MSILNVNKINPVGGGSTITIAGIASVTNNISVGNSVTANSFHGDGSQLTGISAGTSLSGSTNNTVCTVTGANAIQGEANLTFDGSILNINAGVPSLKLTDSDGGPCFHEIKGPGNGDLRLSCDVGNTSSSGSEIQFLIHDAEKAIITSGGDLKFNSGYGSVATAFGVRAWVSFNGTNMGLRGTGGVTSVGDNGTGDYTVNFDNNMPDTGYAVGGLSENWEGTNNDSYTQISGYTGGAAVGSYRFVTLRSRFDQQPPQKQDPPFVQLIFVR